MNKCSQHLREPYEISCIEYVSSSYERNHNRNQFFLEAENISREYIIITGYSNTHHMYSHINLCKSSFSSSQKLSSRSTKMINLLFLPLFFFDSLHRVLF